MQASTLLRNQRRRVYTSPPAPDSSEAEKAAPSTTAPANQARPIPAASTVDGSGGGKKAIKPRPSASKIQDGRAQLAGLSATGQLSGQFKSASDPDLGLIIKFARCQAKSGLRINREGF